MIDYLRVAYPGWVQNEEEYERTVAAYADNLGDVDLADMGPAADDFVRTSTRRPTVAALRELAHGHKAKREATERQFRRPDSGRGYTPDANFLRERELAGIRRDVLKGLFRREIWPEEWDDEPPTRPIVRAMP
jgi:hypothetical protein